MVIKSLSRKATSGNAGQLLSYVLRYATNEQKLLDPNAPFLIKHHVFGQSIDEIAKQFLENEAGRIYKRSDQISLQHTILSWHKDDSGHVTNEMLTDIVNKFISLRGENNLYVVSKHEDKSHIHLHAVVSATSLDGMSSRLSQKEFANLKLELQEYQVEKYPALIHSLPRHGHAKQKIVEARQDSVKAPVKDWQKAAIEHVVKELSKVAYSHDDFLKRLYDLGHFPYYNHLGKLEGVAFDGECKFKFSGLSVPPIELLTQIATNELNDIDQLEELRSIRKLGVEKETELHAREFLMDMYKQGYEREMAKFENQPFFIDPLEEARLDDISESHGA